MDNLALKLVIRDQTENIVFDSLALTVTKVDGTNFGETSFTIADPLNPQVTIIPKQFINSLDVFGSSTTPCFLYFRL